MIENTMEHIAKVTNNDPVEVRIRNMNETDKKVLVPMIETLKKSSDYDNRIQEVSVFNEVSVNYNNLSVYFDFKFITVKITFIIFRKIDGINEEFL